MIVKTNIGRSYVEASFDFSVRITVQLDSRSCHILQVVALGKSTESATVQCML